MPVISQDAKARHWARTRNLTMWMLVIWFIFSFVVPWFAKELNSLSFLGFPLGYYMIVQGSLIVFVVQIGRASCRERVCQSVSLSVGAVSLTIKLFKTQSSHPH